MNSNNNSIRPQQPQIKIPVTGHNSSQQKGLACRINKPIIGGFKLANPGNGIQQGKSPHNMSNRQAIRDDTQEFQGTNGQTRLSAQAIRLQGRDSLIKQLGRGSNGSPHGSTSMVNQGANGQTRLSAEYIRSQERGALVKQLEGSSSDESSDVSEDTYIPLETGVGEIREEGKDKDIQTRTSSKAANRLVAKNLLNSRGPKGPKIVKPEI